MPDKGFLPSKKEIAPPPGHLKKRTAKAKLKAKMEAIVHSLAEIEMYLRKNRGSIAEAAREMDISRPALQKKIDVTPGLLNVLKDIKDEVVDRTEQRLYDSIEDGNVTAITFMLRTQGKDRGYSEKSTLEIEAGKSLTAAGLIDSMRKGIEMKDDGEDIIDLEDDEWDSEETL